MVQPETHYRHILSLANQIRYFGTAEGGMEMESLAVIFQFPGNVRVSKHGTILLLLVAPKYSSWSSGNGGNWKRLVDQK